MTDNLAISIPEEEQRLASLRALYLLDTPPDERFDRLTRLGQRLFGVSFAAIVLADADRVWVKSAQGFSLRETPRKGSLFDEPVLSGTLSIVPDAYRDPRFASNPEVIGPPHFRFFAAFPLFAVDGSAIGAVCIGDTSPRILCESDQALLRDLAHTVEEQIDANGLVENFVKVLESAKNQVFVRDHLVDMVSHELRTPLNGILGFTQLLLQGITGALNAEQEACLRDVLDSATHLSELVEDALDLTKVESGTMRYQPQRVRVPALIEQVVASLERVASERKIQVRVDLQPDLPEAMLDPVRFRQVAYNYLSNALKYTHAGGLITVRVSIDNDTCRLEVEDTGIGIRPQDLGSVFTAFSHIRQRASSQVGTGLGLVLTKRVVEAQGGQVGVTSQLGRGSTFYAVLPLTNEAHDAR